jgi:hypothetical protein
MPQVLRSKHTTGQGGKLLCQKELDRGLSERVREADREQGEDAATAVGWGEAGQRPAPEENASALPAEPQRLTRQALPVMV